VDATADDLESERCDERDEDHRRQRVPRAVRRIHGEDLERELHCDQQSVVCHGSPQMTGQVANEQMLLNPASRTLYVGINACESTEQLDVAARLVWERYGVGAINDDEASYLASCIERRRPLRPRRRMSHHGADHDARGRAG